MNDTENKKLAEGQKKILNQQAMGFFALAIGLFLVWNNLKKKIEAGSGNGGGIETPEQSFEPEPTAGTANDNITT